MKYFDSMALALALATPLLCVAQSPASAPASGLHYPSAFADYRPYQDIPTGNWQALNDTVRDVGGAMAHGMAMPPASAAASASVAAPSKAARKAPMRGPMDHAMPGGTK